MKNFTDYFIVLARVKDLYERNLFYDALKLAEQEWNEIKGTLSDIKSDELLSSFIPSMLSFAAQSAIKTGDLEKALEYAGIGLDISLKSEPTGYSSVRSYNNRGLVYHELGKLHQAESDYNEALKIIDQNDSVELISIRASVLNNLGVLKIQRGEKTESFGDLTSSNLFDTPFKSGLPTIIEKVHHLNSLGSIAMNNGELTDAVKNFNEAIKIGEKENVDNESMGILYCNMAETKHKQKENQSAINYHKKACEIHSRSEGKVEPLAIDLNNLGQIYSEINENEEALKCFKKAWNLLSVESPNALVTLNVLKNLGLQRIGLKDFRRASACFKRGMDIYEQTRPDISTREEGHESFLSAYRNLTELALYLALNASWNDLVLELIEKAKARYWREKIFLTTRNDIKNQDAIENPMNFIRSARHLSDLTGYNSLVLDFFVGPNALFVSYSFNQSLGACRIDISEKELTDLVLSVRNDLMSSSRRAGTGPHIKKFSELLFSRVDIDNEKVRHIFILPDGPLWYLPFEALFTQKKQTDFQEDARFFKIAPISYAPSISVLKDIKKSKPGKPKNEKKRFLSVLLEEGSSGFDSLIGTSREIEEIKETLLRSIETKHLINETATKQSFIDNVSDYSHIHIASHAVSTIDENRPYILFFGNKSSQSCLFADEIEQLTIKAELVFLSACSTSIGESSLGEGLMSLARAFLWAGAKCVIASQWPISDDTVPEFVSLFYNILFSGNSVAKTLQICREKYFKTHKDIRTWAAFQAFGDADLWEDMYSLKHIDVDFKNLRNEIK